VVSAGDRGQPKLPVGIFELAAALAQLGRFDEARSAVKAGLALNPTYSIARVRADWAAESDDPTYLAQLEPIFDGMRKAGVPASPPRSPNPGQVDDEVPAEQFRAVFDGLARRGMPEE
jgi:hypothetical protein